MLEIYTDGGNSLKNKVGGSAAVIVKDGVVIAELSEAYEGSQATNNACELGAVILGCQYILNHPELGKDIDIVSDSEYVVNGSSTWLAKWKLRNWKTTTGMVKNKELWEAILYLKSVLNLTFKWTKGHSTNRLNNLADELAGNVYRKLIKS